MLKVRPISDLRNHFTKVRSEVMKNNNDTLFTINGEPAIVALSFDKYSKLAHLDYVERALDEADIYAASHSEDLTHEDVFSRIKEKING